MWVLFIVFALYFLSRTTPVNGIVIKEGTGSKAKKQKAIENLQIEDLRLSKKFNVSMFYVLCSKVNPHLHLPDLYRISTTPHYFFPLDPERRKQQLMDEN